MDAAKIISELGGLTAVSKGTGIPITTIFYWTKTGEIPEWRRDAVKRFAKRKKVEVDL